MVLVSENKLSGLSQVRNLINLSSDTAITKVNDLGGNNGSCIFSSKK